jgi:gamma-glutamylcyclotransferase (GGCT)/AIG2-like uncharacterized protein YtfP
MKRPHLFAYGTLQVDAIMRAVTGHAYSSQAATLSGYARYRIKNATYPGIIADTRAETSGRIYFDVDDTSWTKLDAFEGAPYQRLTLSVVAADGATYLADAYVIPASARGILSTAPWMLDQFLAHDQDTFMATYFAVRQPRPSY